MSRRPSSSASPASSEAPARSSERRGPLLFIGGGEARDCEAAILAAFVRLSGGAKARICILASASRNAARGGSAALESIQTYTKAFEDAGAHTVQVLNVYDRESARKDPEVIGHLRAATGVYITGGDQARLPVLLGGTPVWYALREACLQNGACVAGTSAGASVLAEHMIAGAPSDPLPHKGQVPLAVGLGLVRHALIDQHFTERQRLGRLLAALAHNPQLIGVGVDEDTALAWIPGQAVEVLGSGAVTLLDPRSLVLDTVLDVDQGEKVALSGVRLHLLPAGFRADLDDVAIPGDLREVLRWLGEA